MRDRSAPLRRRKKAVDDSQKKIQGQKNAKPSKGNQPSSEGSISSVIRCAGYARFLHVFAHCSHEWHGVALAGVRTLQEQSRAKHSLFHNDLPLIPPAGPFKALFFFCGTRYTNR